MNIFDIVGPVMVGPSSSHTAGAVKIGLACRKLLAEDIKSVNIALHGSFLLTGRGHGTDKAIVAGLLGFEVDDSRIPHSLEIAKEKGIEVTFSSCDLGENAHPNSAKLDLVGKDEKELEVVASSLGGGRILINQLDGLDANFSGDYPTLIVHNQDKPGHVAQVTSMLQKENINIATMQLYRAKRGGDAVMVIEVDSEVPRDSLDWLLHVDGVKKVTYYSLED